MGSKSKGVTMSKKIELVNLSGQGMDLRRPDMKDKKIRRTNVLPEYQGLNVITRAKKAANLVSNNGKCWWVYDYVYRELTWRDKK